MNSVANSVVIPQIKYLTEIMDDISKGEVRVPKFQRPYVWKQNDIISLFDSIYKGYPIGSLLFWETDVEIESLSRIGPYNIPASRKKDINYILDGHQRLSTFYGVLRRTENATEDSTWNLYFDLNRQEFIFPTKNELSNYLLPMNKVVSTLDFLSECRKIQNEFKEQAVVLINKAEELAQTILTYKATITQIKGGDLNSAVEIFSRLNTKGLDITPDQMFSALTYKEGKNQFMLSDRIDQILQKLVEYRFSEIGRIFIFRAVIAASKRDIYTVKLEDLAKDAKVDISDIVNKSEDSILQAASFLYHHLKVPGDKLLPYNLQIVFLSEFFFNCPKPSIEKLNQLEKWFWFTSYSGWFAGASSSKIGKGLDEIRAFAKDKSENLSTSNFSEYAAEFPDKFDFRFARVKAFVLFLLSLNPRPLIENNQFDAFQLLGEQGSKSLHYVIPELNESSNRLILGPVKYGFARKTFLDQSHILSLEVLQSHAITEEALLAIRKDDYYSFLLKRSIELTRLEAQFMYSKGLNSKMVELKLRKNPFISKDQLSLFDVFVPPI